MRKRSKYRPRPLLANPVAYAVESVTSVAEFDTYLDDLKIKNHMAMHALTRGQADRHDMDTLIAMANIMEAFRLMGICTPLADEIAAARRAIIDIIVRAVKVLGFRATGPEIVALNTLMELHDEMMPGITCGQMDEAIRVAKRVIKNGGATVLPDVKDLTK